MADRATWSALLRLLAVLVLLALASAVFGCSQDAPSSSGGGQESPAPVENTDAAEEPAKPEYTSWEVHINDDDSYTEGPITYKIALNLTATNPTGDAAGKYTGQATASTSTNGTVSGAKGSGQLEANAIANSGTLEFTLEDTTDGGKLGGITTSTAEAAALYSGKGTITMNAAGTASVNGASGGFSNTSGQQIDVNVEGSKVTLKVDISGHTYTFDGTISGK